MRRGSLATVGLYVPRESGGVYYYGTSLASALISQGQPVHTTMRSIARDGRSSESGIVEAAAAPADLPLFIRKARSLQSHLRDRFDVLRAVSGDGVDIMHFVWLSRLMTPGFLRRVQARVPVVLTVHNVLPHECSDEAAVSEWRSVYDSVDGLVCHTAESVASVERIFGSATARKCRVIRHPVGQPWWASASMVEKAAARKRLGLPAGRKLFLAFGAIRPYKNPELLLRAWRGVMDERGDCSLLFVGPEHADMPRASLEGLIDQLGVRAGVVTRVGWASAADVPLYMQACDCAVLPYERIDASGVASTAAYWDVPMLLSDTPGFTSEWPSDLVRFAPLNAESWTGAILSVLQDLDQVSHDAAVLGRSVREWNSWEAAAAEHMRFYRYVSEGACHDGRSVGDS